MTVLTALRVRSPLLAAPSSKAGRSLFCCVLFCLLCARRFTIQFAQTHQVSFVDDAYYYFVVARHVAANGVSSFDGFTLSNGYHPLWLGLLAVQYRFFGESQVLTRIIEFLLGLGTLVSALLLVRLPNLLLQVLFTVGLFAILCRISFNGMETALFACCLGSLMLSCWPSQSSDRMNGVWLGILAAATIAARVDAAVFVIPAVILSQLPLRSRMLALGVVGVCGAFYAWVNEHIFGVAMPISGEVKSLGGLQVNFPLLHELGRLGSTPTLLFWITIGFVLISVTLPQVRRRLPQRLAFTFAIGFSIFFLRLCFFSSWQIWAWYAYPLLLAYLVCFPAILLSAQSVCNRMLTSRQALVAAVLIAVTGLVLFLRGFAQGQRVEGADMYALNRKAIQVFGPIMGGTRVAMGDRGGNFAYQYAGGVTQLEGLMNDKTYLDVLRKGGDVRGLLCRRKVRFVLAYEPDLGTYQTYGVQTIRSNLSQFHAPIIPVTKQDEVGRLRDLAIFDARLIGDVDSYLYLWRLECH